MNKKGFTLIEILAAIIIISILGLIVIPKAFNVISKNKTKLYKDQEVRLEEAANKYLTDIYTGSDSDIVIQKNELIYAGYIGEIYDLTDTASICNAYVIVSNIDTNPAIDAYISCDNYVTEGYDSSNIL